MTGPISASLGLIRAISAGIDPVGYFRRQAGQVRPFSLKFPGLGEVLFVGTAEGARDILTIPPASSEAPTPNPIEPIVGPGSLILLSGEQHRRERSLLMPAFHGERIKGYTDIIAAATTDEIDSLRAEDTVAVRQLATAITLHIAVRVVFGVSDAARRDVYTEAIATLMRANTAPLMLVPALRREIAGRGPWAKLLRLRDHLDGLLSDDIAARREQGGIREDMLDVLLSATDENGSHHGQEELHDQLRTLLAAGHDTTATALTWVLYHLHRDDEVRDRVIAELADDPTPLEMTALPYLGAVIKESLRMHPPVPIVLRRLTDPATVGGTDCVVGDVVGIAVNALHFDPSVWPDPDRFDPDRFIGRRVSPFEYAPFGGGHRRCIGASFATAELAVAVGTIVRSLDLRMPARERMRAEPRSVARGIAVTPGREIILDVVNRHRTSKIPWRQGSPP